MKVKEALLDILLSVLKGLKALVLSVLPATIAILILDPRFSEFLANNFSQTTAIALGGVIATIARDYLKRSFPDNKYIQML